MSDMPEGYVKKAEVVVTIKNNVSESRYTIEDSSMSVFLEFSPDSCYCYSPRFPDCYSPRFLLIYLLVSQRQKSIQLNLSCSKNAKKEIGETFNMEL